MPDLDCQTNSFEFTTLTGELVVADEPPLVSVHTFFDLNSSRVQNVDLPGFLASTPVVDNLSGVVISYVLFPVHVGFLLTYFFYLSPEKGTPTLLCYLHFFLLKTEKILLLNGTLLEYCGNKL